MRMNDRPARSDGCPWNSTFARITATRWPAIGASPPGCYASDRHRPPRAILRMIVVRAPYEQAISTERGPDPDVQDHAKKRL